MSKVSELDKSDVPLICQWCSSSDVPSLRKCSRCRMVYYCCKDHQKRHWKVHKQSCTKTSNNSDSPNNVDKAKNVSELSDSVKTSSVSKPSASAVDYDPLDVCCSDRIEDTCLSSHSTTSIMNSIKPSWPSTEWASNTTSQCLGLRPTCSTNVNSSQTETGPSSERVKATTSPCPNPAVRSIPWFQKICQNVVSDMNNYGICVLDNLLGPERGNAILKEVMHMYKHDIFTEGQLVNSKIKGPSQAIRGDRITWVHGTEPGCENVGFLIQILDSVITTCTKMKNSGLLGQVKIQRHTKAMIACYPGNGTHYVKHVDNPHGDGRCVTTIYYLNKNWEKKHAGRLRIFPANYENQVAEIEPIFDRIVFFWSDRRNPHEVEPSFAVRFAITVWYFDDEERNNALKRYQQEVKKPEL